MCVCSVAWVRVSLGSPAGMRGSSGSWIGWAKTCMRSTGQGFPLWSKEHWNGPYELSSPPTHHTTHANIFMVWESGFVQFYLGQTIPRNPHNGYQQMFGKSGTIIMLNWIYRRIQSFQPHMPICGLRARVTIPNIAWIDPMPDVMTMWCQCSISKYFCL